MAWFKRPGNTAIAVGIVGLAAAFSATLQSPVSAQARGEKPPALIISSLDGRDLFEFYCATCHGRDGKGNGPTAPALLVPPPDLTRIAARNGGAFPRTRVEAFVAGDLDMPTAHGSRDMPVWGPIFHALDPNDRLNRVRLANIVDYIMSIQVE